MKSAIRISILLFMLLTTSSFAQEMETNVEKRVDRLAEYLEMDMNQKVAATIIFTEYGNQLRFLRLRITKGKTEDREIYRQALKDQDKALLDVFNDVQKTKYINLRRGQGKLHEGKGKENVKERRARKNNRKVEANGK